MSSWAPLDLARLRQSLNAQLNAEARRRGVAVGLVRKQYIFAVFLSRIFAVDGGQWVLLGGNALLIRTGGGRFTQDVDLARKEQWTSVEAACAELQELAAHPRSGDPFDFDLFDARVQTEVGPYGYGAETGKIKVRARLGTTEFESFSIDITARRHVDGAVDLVPLQAIIEHETLGDLPAVPTVPVENHLADKICAMYEKHGADGKVSTRWRDLADIVRMVAELPFEASRLSLILDREAGRRRMTLPALLESPGGLWAAEFPKAAAGFSEFPAEHRELESALSVAGACLNEVLDGSRTEGRWEPGRGWR